MPLPLLSLLAPRDFFFNTGKTRPALFPGPAADWLKFDSISQAISAMLAAAVQATKRRRLADRAQATGSPLDASGCSTDACGESCSNVEGDSESCIDGAGVDSCSEGGQRPLFDELTQ